MKLLRSLLSLLSNVATFLLSLVLATIIWITATQAQDPTIIKPVQVPLAIPVPSDAALISPNSPNLNVTLTIEGRASLLENVTSRDFTTSIDLSQVAYGVETPVDIVVQQLNPNITITSRDPQRVNIHLEALVTRDISVDVDVRGEPARGHSMGELTVSPTNITVTGVESTVDSLDFALVTLFLNNDRETVTDTRPFIIYDKQGQVVSVRNLQLSTRDVEVTIPINEAADFAEKLISVDLEGAPASGYRLLRVDVEPSSVLVQGSPSQLDALTQVRTEPVDITGLTESFITPVSLELPNGVMLDEIPEIIVTVEIEPFQSSQTFRKFIEVQGLADGLETELSANTVAVVLFGPSPILQTLNEDEIMVSVDLFGLGVGTHSGLVPNVTFPDRGIELRSFDPMLISAKITRTLTTTTSLTDTHRIVPQPVLVGDSGTETARGETAVFPISRFVNRANEEFFICLSGKLPPVHL